MTIPATCKDFVSHPHIVEIKRVWRDKDGNQTKEETRMGGCYICQCASASEEQGTSQIAEELIALGTPADVVQTGGFTMCVYIKTGEESYIYANTEGFSFYCDEDCEGLREFDFREEMTPNEKAKEIKETMERHNLKALQI